MRKGVRFAVAALTLALAPPAGAESISYVEAGNVFIATPDGARRVQITSSGTNDSPFTLAGHADNGKVVTAFGPGSSRTWFMFNPDGTNSSEGPNLVPMKQCGSALGSTGPIDPRLHPDGDLVAYNYFCNYPPGGGGPDINLAVDIPKVYTASSSSGPLPLASDLLFPSFFGKRLVVQGTNILIQDSDASNPFTTTFSDWILPDPNEDIVRAEVARPGGRVLIDTKVANVPKIALATFVNIGEYNFACFLGVASGDPSDGAFSPDGTKLAWVDSGGVKVGQIDLGRSDCIVPGSVKTLSATGSNPRWSAYSVPEPVQTPTQNPYQNQSQNTQTTTQTTTPAAATLAVAVAASAKLKQIVKGLVVGYDVNGAGVVEAALTMPAKQAKKLGVARVAAAQVRLGYAKKSVTAAGKGKLTVKLTKKAKKRARRLRGRTLTLRTTFTPSAGTPVVAAKKLRIR